MSVSAYQDVVTLGVDECNSFTAIKGSAGLSIESGGQRFGISSEYEHRFETACIPSCIEHTTGSTPWEVYACSQTQKTPFQFNLPLVKQIEGDFSDDMFIGIGGEAHFLFGGHYQIGWDLRTFIDELFEE